LTAEATARAWTQAAGATLVAGHSAHVFHGIADRVLYDLGDFVDDSAADPYLRNDLGLLSTPLRAPREGCNPVTMSPARLQPTQAPGGLPLWSPALPPHRGRRAL